jgi:hypothetical protein
VGLAGAPAPGQEMIRSQQQEFLWKEDMKGLLRPELFQGFYNEEAIQDFLRSGNSRFGGFVTASDSNEMKPTAMAAMESGSATRIAEMDNTAQAESSPHGPVNRRKSQKETSPRVSTTPTQMVVESALDVSVDQVSSINQTAQPKNSVRPLTPKVDKLDSDESKIPTSYWCQPIPPTYSAGLPTSEVTDRSQGKRLVSCHFRGDPSSTTTVELESTSSTSSDSPRRPGTLVAKGSSSKRKNWILMEESDVESTGSRDEVSISGRQKRSKVAVASPLAISRPSRMAKDKGVAKRLQLFDDAKVPPKLCLRLLGRNRGVLGRK